MADSKLLEHVKSQITAEQAEALGRAAFAGAVLNDGHVALICVLDHKRKVGCFDVYGFNDNAFVLTLDRTLKTPAEYEAEALYTN